MSILAELSYQATAVYIWHFLTSICLGGDESGTAWVTFSSNDATTEDVNQWFTTNGIDFFKCVIYVLFIAGRNP